MTGIPLLITVVIFTNPDAESQSFKALFMSLRGDRVDEGA
jgi:hypothetical protein